jgi:hypothetical protein
MKTFAGLILMKIKGALKEGYKISLSSSAQVYEQDHALPQSFSAS